MLDGNVTRVLSRLFRVEENVKSPPVQKRLWQLARELIPRGKAGWFNQAMMDLGATICIPRRPTCTTCPVRRHCEALTAGLQAVLPRKPKATPVPHYTIVAGMIRKNGRLLIDRRREDQLLGGLWELPGGKVQPGESLPEALRREVREEVGIDIDVGSEIAVVEHAYSHFKITLHAFECRHLRGRARAIECNACKWVRPAEFDDYAFPAANRKIFDALDKRGNK